MIDLRSLSYVVTLARRLSFARAAEDLGISQPALTRAVQAVEKRFDVRLFDRDRSGVRVTAQGQAMLDAAAVLLANANDLERQWDRTAKGQSGDVYFGMAPMPARALLSATVLERLKAAPGVRNIAVVRNVDALWPLLVAGEIEFFVAAEGQVPEAVPVRAEVVGTFPNSLIVRRGHPLLTGTGTDARFPILTSSRSGMSHAAGLEDTADGAPHVIEDFGALVQLTASSDAIWRTSSYAVAEEITRGLLCELPRSRGNAAKNIRMMMYRLERRSQSVGAKSLAQIMRRLTRQLSGQKW
ncbi:LysR family transcriptional regulator [Novosphingobium sp. G106]|uniref:LysR family transcriptional regulator n=1 Tax=Novosphingobium sp. G106 TaxID=2849500 RepID=UPI001C2DD9ED|nr:LysR family transcriptional regulator [Novosphingobium sp. G106]MBV1690408.1 LysR family transcriptional regulator [Novosphingobium sp. G106]